MFNYSSKSPEKKKLQKCCLQKKQFTGVLSTQNSNINQLTLDELLSNERQVKFIERGFQLCFQYLF